MQALSPVPEGRQRSLEARCARFLARQQPLGNRYACLTGKLNAPNNLTRDDFVGNAWAAAGMLRVLETISRSSQAAKFVAEQADLTAWINEILTHVWAFQVRTFSATLGSIQIVLSVVSAAHERDPLQLHRQIGRAHV